MSIPPTTYADSNDRGNDPWDHDAVCWMLDQLGREGDWTYHNLFECSRRQRNRMENDLDRVIEAANVCGRLGVRQIELRDPKIGKVIIRLRRTDPNSPEYPQHYDSPAQPVTRMNVSDEDRVAARRLLDLLGVYEQELISANKSRFTVNTYVDRAERFLKRVANG
jgi:hypothetical protein